MAAMDSVEVADCCDGWTEVSRDLGERSKNGDGPDHFFCHAQPAPSSTEKLNWSCARRMLSGSLALVSSWPSSWAMCVSQVCFAPMRWAHPTACSTVAWLGCGL